MRRRKNERVLRPAHPNAGAEAAYRKKLERLVDEMHRSVDYWIKAQYRAKPPELAQDATPAAELQKIMNRLRRQWLKRFDEAAQRLARYFALSAGRRNDEVLRRILREGGISVEFKLTPAMRDVMGATVNENVALIKSIPQRYLSEVEGMVMRSVSAGRDLHGLNKELLDRYRITRRRAALIARDQNNKATAVIQRVRQTEAGIEEAVWLHSHAGKKPRKTHLANDGKRYKVAEGWFDPDPKVRRRIWPGELINCRCVPKPVVQGLS